MNMNGITQYSAESRGEYEIWNEKNKSDEVVKRQNQRQGDTCSEKALIPGYGKKGMGILHPKRALYSKVYKKTTFGLGDIFKLFR